MTVVPHANGEVLLSKIAIDSDPVFFQYPFQGRTVPKRKNNPSYPYLYPRPLVDIIIYDQNRAIWRKKSDHPLYVVDYERKSEIRMTIPDRLHDHIPAGSTMVMKKDPHPSADYQLEFYPPGTAPTNVLAAMAIQLPRGGGAVVRRYGWL